MSSENRIEFVSSMVPKCLKMIFSEIEPAARQSLAKEMVNKMMLSFQEQLRPDTK